MITVLLSIHLVQFNKDNSYFIYLILIHLLVLYYLDTDQVLQ